VRLRLAVAALLAATSAFAQQVTGILHAGTKEVVLDLVVRDSHGRMITNLRPDEVEVFEDGVRQTIKSYRFIEAGEQLEAEKAAQAQGREAAGDPRSPLNSTREVNFVAIVFANIGLNNRAFAREAALRFLNSGALLNTFVTLYSFDYSLHLLQPYTKNKQALAAAIKNATERFSHTPTNPGLLAAASAVTQATLASAAAAGTNTSTAGAGAVRDPKVLNLDGVLAQSPEVAANVTSIGASRDLSSALQAESQLENAQRFVTNQVDGMNSLDALNALVRSESELQGRKVVIFLSDGLTVPGGACDELSQMESTANRSGVTFYRVDTRGLSLQSPLAGSQALMTQAINENRARQNLAFSDMNGFNDVELSAPGNVQSNLAMLAQATGGFAVTNTNEIAKPMQRIMEDIRTHYEISYTPSSDN
jgi:VWFA-related protein